MSRTRQRSFAYASLAVLFLAFLAAVMASNTLLRGIRIDLTENNLYTLSPGTRSLLANLEEPINLYFFFSDRATENVQYLRAYAQRVREMLEEFENAAGGRLNLQIIDPVPFSEDEDRAAQFGLTNLNLSSLTGGDSIYLGLAATNSVGDEAVIEFFDPEKEGSLEYDLARLIYSLSTPEKNVIGLMSGVPMSGGFNPQLGQPTPPWIMNQQVRQLFEVRNISASVERIDDDIDFLWIVHPTNLGDNALYAIDQFLLRGGRALIFVDPLAEVAMAMPDPTGAGPATSSDLGRLFDAWGLEYDPGLVVADDRYALSVSSGGFGSRPMRHIGLLGLEGDAINDEDVVTAGLSSINVGTAGSLSLSEDSGLSLEPLLTSSPDSALLPAARFQFLSDPSDLLDGFTPDGETHVLAARLEGRLVTAFPDGPPAAEDPADESAGDDADTEAAAGAAEASGAAGDQLMETDDANLIVVADVDILSDRLWVQRQRSLLGQELMTAFANNGDFVTNAIGNLSGSRDLIGLKSRATYSRPFDRVQQLRREADARFRATEERLEAELAETERRLGELQESRDDSGSLLMSPEQQAEVERFRAEQLRIRQELRAVQRELDSSIERLGTWLRAMNIIVFPLGLALLALLVYAIRRSRRRSRH